MKGAVVLVSLRYNPAFVQFLIAFARALGELKYTVRFLLAPGYEAFRELEEVAPVLTNIESLESAKVTHAIFFNVAGQNAGIAAALKQNDVRIIYIYHEPWKASLRFLASDGLVATMKAATAQQLSVAMMKVADAIILGSRYALDTYRRDHIGNNSNAWYFPLIYDDEAGDVSPERLHGKVYLSYLGNISRVHGFDCFVNVMRDLLQRGVDINFLVASRQPLPGYVAQDRLLRSYSQVVYRCGRVLQAAEINQCYADSFCIWNLYRRSTQSAVLPKAFMFGTPVIASQGGSFPEFVRDGENGRFARLGDLQGIREAVEDMRTNRNAYAANCRRTFLETFLYRSRLDDLQRLLEL